MILKQSNYRIGRNKRVFLILLLMIEICISYSCIYTPDLRSDKVKQLYFNAIPRHIDFNYGIFSFEDFWGRANHERDSIITDRLFIEEFIEKINSLHRSANNISPDIRMVIVIEFDNGDMVPVCFGEFHNRTILYNGVVMRPDSTLYDFVLLNIYSKYLPRNWVIENTLETSNDINNQLRDFLRKDTTSLLEMIPYEEDIIQ